MIKEDTPTFDITMSDDEETDFIGFSPVKTKHEEQSTKSDQVNPTDIEQANTMAKQLHVFKPGITFVPGAKLEVLDARDNKWYHCKVVEVDWGELDILVHYERWSVRFDEWLKMDSTRIRPIDLNKEKNKTGFKPGEKVLGYWAPDSKYYFCQIKKQSTGDYYEVLFYDGFVKRLRSNQLKKITNPKQLSGIEFKSPRRQQNRRVSAPTSLTLPSTSEETLEPQECPSSSDSVMLDSVPSSEATQEAEDVTSPSDTQTQAPFSKKNIFNVEILEEKRKTKRKPDVEEVFKIRKRKRRSEMKEETFKDESPQLKLKASGIVVNEGMPSDDCKFFEIEIGHGWRKVCTRRMHGAWMGKWDVYFLTPDLKKLRVRPELVKYCNEHSSPINPSQLDFSVRSAKQKYDALNQKEKQTSTQIKQEVLSDDDTKTETKGQKTQDVCLDDPTDEFSEDDDYAGDDLIDSSDDESEDENLEDEPKAAIKDIVKKRESSSSESESESSPEKPSNSPSLKLGQILIDSIKKESVDEGLEEPLKSVEDVDSPVSSKNASKGPSFPQSVKPESFVGEELSGKQEMAHKCPSKNCEKSFRKENLLQMHMKHYHPELLKSKSLQAPNVADLAYARTVGDHLDVVSLSPSSVSFPSVEFMVPNKKEVLRKSKENEGKKLEDKKQLKVKPSKPFKESKKEREPCKEEASDSDYGNEMGDFLPSVKEEDEAGATSGKAELRKMETDLMKTKPPKRFPRERTLSKSEVTSRFETTRRRSRKSESMSEDDPPERVTKYRTSRRKSLSIPKPSNVSSADGQPESLDNEEENIEAWNESNSEHQDAIIHCGCESQEEDGLMLQCDVCLTWQHGGCYNIESEEQVPEKYICSLCENPKGQRSSMRFKHHQEWLKEGKLPRFSFSTSEPNVKLESCIRRGHDLSANVTQLSHLLYSLRLKLSISREADHPKFVMWHKKWSENQTERTDPKKADLNLTVSEGLPVQESSSPFDHTNANEIDQTYSADSGARGSKTDNKDDLTTDQNPFSDKIDELIRDESTGGYKPSVPLDSVSQAVQENSTSHKKLFDPKGKVNLGLIDDKPKPLDLIGQPPTSQYGDEDKQPKPKLLVGNDAASSAVTSVASGDVKTKAIDDIKQGESPDSVTDQPPKQVKECEDVEEETKQLKEEKLDANQLIKIDSEQKVDNKPEGPQDPLEDLELALGALGAGGESGINDGLADLLSSNPVFETLVDVAGSELTPLVQNPIAPNPAPIIPKNERIEPANCKMNLLLHVEELQEKAFKRFDFIEEQIKALEAEMGLTSEISREEEELLTSGDVEERDAATLQARALVNLTLRDIETVKKLAMFSDS